MLDSGVLNLRPYPEYKGSGVDWLGDVPAHWSVARAKSVLQKRNRTIRKDDDVITCFRDGVVTLRRWRRTAGFTESLNYAGYQGIRKGDLVIHAMDAFAGAIGVADSDGKGTSVYIVCTPRKSSVTSSYVALCLREMARSGWILALAKGIRERSTDFRFSVFGSQKIPLPSVWEQEAVAFFMDYVDGRIRRLVEAREQGGGLLEEYKKAAFRRLLPVKSMSAPASPTLPTNPPA